MAIIMMSEVLGQTAAGYDRVLETVGAAVSNAPGFVAHAAFEDKGAWKLVEIWQSKQECDAFFVQHIAPFLPDGVRPKRTYHQVHALLLPPTAG